MTLAIREGTSDFNSVNSVMGDHDEYRLRELVIEGTALDIGAHVGSVTIALLADNPNLHVVSVEPVPDNVRLFRANLALNDLSDRCTVIDGAACGVGDRTASIWYGRLDNESAAHHRFIGNSSLAYDHGGDAPHETREAPCTNLAEIVKAHGDLSFAKIDCEGCEYAFLDCGCVNRIALIHGEWHPVRGQGQPEILKALDLTHVVTFSGPQSGPGGFEAVRRA